MGNSTLDGGDGIDFIFASEGCTDDVSGGAGKYARFLGKVVDAKDEIVGGAGDVGRLDLLRYFSDGYAFYANQLTNIE